MKKIFLVIFSLLLSFSCLGLFACSNDNGNKVGPNNPFIINRADIPDAYVGYEYDLYDTIIKQEGVSYSAEVYTKNGGQKNNITVSGMKFTSTLKDVYVYAVITATMNEITVVSEEIRIRSVNAFDGFTVKKNTIPDAYNGVEYDISKLIITTSGISYSASVYYFENEQKVDIPLNNLIFTPSIENTYIYAVITATDGTYTTNSEPLRICCYPSYANPSLIKDFIIEEKYRADVNYMEKFDLNSIIYVQEGVSYTAQAYYGEGENKEYLTIEDFCLTPTKLYEPIHIIFTAEKDGDTYTTEPIEVKTTARTDAKDDFVLYLTSSSGIKKTIVKEKAYVKDGNTSMLVSYQGKNANQYKNIASFAGDYLTFCDVTDWQNAVVTFWVYNNENEDIYVNISLKHNQKTSNGIYETVESKSFKKVAFSLKVLGLTEKMFYNPDYYYSKDSDLYSLVDTISVMARLSSNNKESFELYFDGLNIEDYEEEKFPDLPVPQPLQENEIVFVNNRADLINFANAAVSGDFALATEDQLAGISGEYKGNAVVANITGEYCVPKIYPRITEEDWDNAVKSGYTNMYVWIAITTPEHKGALVLNNEDISKSKVLARSDSGNPTLGTWKKVTFALSEANKAKMFDANGAKLVQIYYWTNPNYTAYVGNVGFDEETKGLPMQEGEILFVTEEGGATGFANAAVSGDFALATGDQLAGISGEYKGNALVANIPTSAYCMPKIYPRIAEEDWDKAIEDGYSKMYVWVAVVLSNDVQKINVNNENIAISGVLQRSDGAHSGTINVKTWTKFTFDLTEENKAKMFDANGAKLIQLYYWQRPADVIYEVFVGNVGFDTETKQPS